MCQACLNFSAVQRWGFSTSFPLPPKGEAPDLEDDGQIVQSECVDTQRKEAQCFNAGVQLPDANLDTDDEEDVDADDCEAELDPDTMLTVQFGVQQFMMTVAQLQAILSSIDEEEDEDRESRDEEGGRVAGDSAQPPRETNELVGLLQELLQQQSHGTTNGDSDAEDGEDDASNTGAIGV